MENVSLIETFIRHPELQKAMRNAEQAVRFEAIVSAVWKLIGLVAVCVIEEIIKRRTQLQVKWPLCPQCGRRLESKGLAPRQMQTLFGLVRWTRRVGRCHDQCRIGQVAPSDEELGIKPYQATCATVERIVCLLAVFLPFQTVAFLLKECCHLEISASCVWHWTQAAGAKAMRQLAGELRQLGEGQPPSPEGLSEEVQRMTLLLGGDGVMVPFRPMPETAAGKIQWREVKVGILARLTQRPTRAGKPVPMLVHKRMVAVLGDMAQFSVRLRLEALRRNIRTAPGVVWISDGARGLWNIYSATFA